MNIGAIATLLIPVLISIYTLNYSRWAWRHQLRRGALGLAVLAVSTVAVPVYVMWLNR